MSHNLDFFTVNLIYFHLHDRADAGRNFMLLFILA
jgi:hypothetical protein